MKQYIKLISFLCFLIMTSCSENTEESTKLKLKVIESQIEFSGKESFGSILIEADLNKELNITFSNAWWSMDGDRTHI